MVTAVVVGAMTPSAASASLAAFGQWLGWFCGVGLLVAINVALAASVVTRRGTPPRFAIALLAATLALYVSSFLLSLVRGWAVNAWVTQQPGVARSILTWLPFASPMQMLLVAVLSLALAWTLGGCGGRWCGPCGRGAGAAQWWRLALASACCRCRVG